MTSAEAGWTGNGLAFELVVHDVFLLALDSGDHRWFLRTADLSGDFLIDMTLFDEILSHRK